MRVLAIDEQGKHYVRDIPHDIVAAGIYREVKQRTMSPMFQPGCDRITVEIRDYHHRGNLFDGTPVMVARPWTVKEAMATDICADHPDYLSHSERMVRHQVHNLCDTAGEWRRIDDLQTITDFSKPQRLKRVEYRILVQVRER